MTSKKVMQKKVKTVKKTTKNSSQQMPELNSGEVVVTLSTVKGTLSFKVEAKNSETSNVYYKGLAVVVAAWLEACEEDGADVSKHIELN